MSKLPGDGPAWWRREFIDVAVFFLLIILEVKICKHLIGEITISLIVINLILVILFCLLLYLIRRQTFPGIRYNFFKVYVPKEVVLYGNYGISFFVNEDKDFVLNDWLEKKSHCEFFEFLSNELPEKIIFSVITDVNKDIGNSETEKITVFVQFALSFLGEPEGREHANYLFIKNKLPNLVYEQARHVYSNTHEHYGRVSKYIIVLDNYPGYANGWQNGFGLRESNVPMAEYTKFLADYLTKVFKYSLLPSEEANFLRVELL